ncbi:MAG: hypothetical protein WBA44_17590 [Mesorhizobium sp.]
MISSQKLQRIAEIVMVLGIVFLCQPWVEFLHRYGLTVIIIGLITFMCTNWFGSAEVISDDANDGAFDVSDNRGGHH